MKIYLTTIPINLKVEAQYGDTFDISITPLSTYVAGKGLY